MQITINELLKGKPTIIKKNDYLSTKDYVEPFLDLMSKYTNNFKVKVITPNQVTYTNQVSTEPAKDTTYNRVLIEAIMPKENMIEGHDEVIGFLYGLDIKSPIAKMYRGYVNQACTNLSVFDPKWLVTQEIKPQTRLQYKVDGLLESQNNFHLKLKKLKNEHFLSNELVHKLGEWVNYCLTGEYYGNNYSVKLSPNLPIKGYKSLLLDDTSSYLLKPGQDPTLFEVHEAMTQVITDDHKDIISHFEKTLMVNEMLGLN